MDLQYPDDVLSSAATQWQSQSPVSKDRPKESTKSPSPLHTDAQEKTITVPSACIQCRSKHLKCDGTTPCQRCMATSLDCLYIRSRRGFKGPRKNTAQGKSVPVTSRGDQRCALIHSDITPSSNTPYSTSIATPGPENHMLSLMPSIDLPLLDSTQGVVLIGPGDASVTPSIRERCIEAFFYYFHPAHPFVVLRTHFYALRKQKSIRGLEFAIQYIGSFYVSQAPTVVLGLEAENALHSAACPHDGYRVQGLLLLAIGLDGYSYQERALSILVEAQDTALEIGMNKRDFANNHGDGSAILEESWRRTWWELYLIDGMIAGVHQKSDFRMKDIVSDVLLPCEESEYMSGNIPHAHSIADFDDEGFDGRDLLYSSYTYRLAAIRILGNFLRARSLMLPNDDIIGKIDAQLVNWRLHLPNHKQTFINQEGQLDEMLFQARMIIEACTIILHREKSELDSSIAQNVTSCAPHKASAPGHTFNIHAAKTIQAAQSISKLIQLPVLLTKHTHFFTCVVTLASIVHLSCWSTLTPASHDDDLKQQLRLHTGALKTLWQVWPSAGQAFAQVKGVAQEIYTAKKQAAEVGYWGNLIDDEVMRSMIEDQTIMDDLQLLT